MCYVVKIIDKCCGFLEMRSTRLFCVLIPLCIAQLNVAETLMSLAIEESPGPVIKYPLVDLTKLYQVVTQLVRCCDLSAKCSSSVPVSQGECVFYGVVCNGY